MQKAKQKYFKDRSIYYTTFPIQEQAQKGEWDFRLNPIYLVAILDFVFDEVREEKFCHRVHLKDDENEVFFQNLNYIFLEMPKFNKVESELESTFDKWLYVLKHLSEFQNRPMALQERVFQKLFKAAEIAKYTREEKMNYEESLKQYRDYHNTIATAFEEGEHKREREIALNALKENLPISMIIKLTGLSEEEIKKLKVKKK
jgi:predicted transposase/invertase (TIGR01784 family)